MNHRAYVAGTFDTKGTELHYLAERLRAARVDVRTVDLSTGGSRAEASKGIDFSASDVAAHHPEGADAVLDAVDRGSAIAAMAAALRSFLISRTDVGGVIGAGGSGGTALLAPAMQALAVGVPKVLVSTVASGNVAPYVGASDLTLVYSVTDVQGLNAISRRVLGNAAHALAGMITHAREIDARQVRPALGLSMFGVTTPCVQAVCRSLEPDYDCLVFHATGTGGQSMEKLADSGLLGAVIDITTTEVADLLVGGVFAAHEDRFGAIIRHGIPYVGSTGALDMVNFGAPGTVPGKWAGRRLHVHNPQVTLMRTDVDENRRIGLWIAERINRMNGPVRFLIPEKGVSLMDVEGEAFHDPAADAALFDALESTIRTTSRRQLIRVPAAVNDDAFAAAVVEQFRSMV